jgi:hypothetical protein
MPPGETSKAHSGLARLDQPLQTFHPFPNLPIELRLMIWDFVAAATDTRALCLKIETILDESRFPYFLKPRRVESNCLALARACKEGNAVYRKHHTGTDALSYQVSHSHINPWSATATHCSEFSVKNVNLNSNILFIQGLNGEVVEGAPLRWMAERFAFRQGGEIFHTGWRWLHGLHKIERLVLGPLPVADFLFCRYMAVRLKHLLLDHLPAVRELSLVLDHDRSHSELEFEWIEEDIWRVREVPMDLDPLKVRQTGERLVSRHEETWHRFDMEPRLRAELGMTEEDWESTWCRSSRKVFGLGAEAYLGGRVEEQVVVRFVRREPCA